MAETVADVGGGTTTQITDWDPYPYSDETTPSRVYVNNVRVPTGDVEIHMRKEGDLDATRYAEGELPSPWDGTQWVEAFDTPNPNQQTSFDTVHIEVRDRVTGNFYTQFHGVVTGVGSAVDGGSKWWQWRAEGPGHRLDDIPASKSFNSIRPEDIFQHVVDRLDDKLPLDITLGDVSVPEGQNADGGEDTEDDENPAEGYSGEYDPDAATEDAERDYSRSFSYPVNTQKSFQYGKHTLADVVTWASRKTNLTVFMQPTPNGAVLHARRRPRRANHEAHYLGGNTKIVNNDALSEIKPANTLVLAAPAKESVKDVNTYQYNERGDQLVAVKARHQTLYERAGEMELYTEPVRVSDAMVKVEAEREARKRLKEAIDESTAGDLQTLLRSPITPFDTIEAKPTVDENHALDSASLTYEIARVHHKITASGIPHTNLNVGVETDPVQDIEIISGWQEDANLIA